MFRPLWCLRAHSDEAVDTTERVNELMYFFSFWSASSAWQIENWIAEKLMEAQMELDVRREQAKVQNNEWICFWHHSSSLQHNKQQQNQKQKQPYEKWFDRTKIVKTADKHLMNGEKKKKTSQLNDDYAQLKICGWKARAYYARMRSARVYAA